MLVMVLNYGLSSVTTTCVSGLLVYWLSLCPCCVWKIHRWWMTQDIGTLGCILITVISLKNWRTLYSDEKRWGKKTGEEYGIRHGCGNLAKNKIRSVDIYHDERSVQGKYGQNPMYQCLQWHIFSCDVTRKQNVSYHEEGWTATGYDIERWKDPGKEYRCEGTFEAK